MMDGGDGLEARASVVVGVLGFAGTGRLVVLQRVGWLSAGS